MIDPKLVNIGTKENPVMVPKQAVSPDKSVQNRWFGSLASGSVVIEDKALDILLEVKDEQRP